MLNYSLPKVRELCHGVKERDMIAIKEMADYLLNTEVVSSGSIIIPAPQHEGFAVYTKAIAEIIVSETKATIKDVVRCKPHKTLYSQKLEGNFKCPEFYLTEKVEGNELFFLDNVISTGTTYRGINKLFGWKLKPLVYAKVR